jgi:hypothetical protein
MLLDERLNEAVRQHGKDKHRIAVLELALEMACMAIQDPLALIPFRDAYRLAQIIELSDTEKQAEFFIAQAEAEVAKEVQP